MIKLALPALVALASVTAVAHAEPDPKALVYTLPDKLEWKGDPRLGPQSINLWGDPAKPGPYAVLIKWPPHQMSRPHFHTYDRHVLVVSGTWWVGTGKTFDPDHTTPLPAGTIVTHFAKEIHYDGAKDEACIIEIAGEGPADPIPAH